MKDQTVLIPREAFDRFNDDEVLNDWEWQTEFKGI